VCDLGEHHLNDNGSYSYRLTKIEVAKTSSGTVFVPGARWDWEQDPTGDTARDGGYEPHVPERGLFRLDP
jgi:hypothetical protein